MSDPADWRTLDRAWWVELRGWLDVAKDSDWLSVADRDRLDALCLFVDGIIQHLAENPEATPTEDKP